MLGDGGGHDDSPQAYEHLVDTLLARPAFGEQRARYWLDYARYADTYGLHYDNSKDIWPYRDYVIAAFNSDKPYDRFLKEQLAGDLLPAASDRQKAELNIATGFLALGPKQLNERNPQQFLDIPMAKATDFQKATERIYWGGAEGSRIKLQALR